MTLGPRGYGVGVERGFARSHTSSVSESSLGPDADALAITNGGPIIQS